MGVILLEQPGNREAVEYVHNDSWFGPGEDLEGCASAYTEYVVLRYALSMHLDLRTVLAPQIVDGDFEGNERRIYNARIALIQAALEKFDVYDGDNFTEFYLPAIYRCDGELAEHWVKRPDKDDPEAGECGYCGGRIEKR